jgi:cell division protein FtsB
MNFKNLDIKTIFIIVLSFGLILSFIFGQKNTIDYKKDELDKLHSMNEELMGKNDSLLKANKELDATIEEIHMELLMRQQELAANYDEITRLKNRRNETSNHVNSLSGNGVASELSKYVVRHKKN